MIPRLFFAAVLTVAVILGATAAAQTAPFETGDLHRLQSVGDVQISALLATSVFLRHSAIRLVSGHVCGDVVLRGEHHDDAHA